MPKVKHKSKSPTRETPFPLVNTKHMRDNFGLTDQALARIREELPAPTYWIQRNRSIQWNLRLCEHWIRCGDCPSHDRLAEYYGTYVDGLAEGIEMDGDRFLQMRSYLESLAESMTNQEKKLNGRT
jgi:hypothetical protein